MPGSCTRTGSAGPWRTSARECREAPGPDGRHGSCTAPSESVPVRRLACCRCSCCLQGRTATLGELQAFRPGGAPHDQTAIFHDLRLTVEGESTGQAVALPVEGDETIPAGIPADDADLLGRRHSDELDAGVVPV